MEGDGRRGYRCLAVFLGITWQEVTQKLPQLMLTSRPFSSQDLQELIFASDGSNPCPSFCWLASKRISLLAVGARGNLAKTSRARNER